VSYGRGAHTCQAILNAGLPPIFSLAARHGFEYARVRADDAAHTFDER